MPTGENGSFNDGREKYFPSQVRLSGGICNLVAEPVPGASASEGSYRSGELLSARANTQAATSCYKFAFQYGYVEARIEIVNVSGFFGAFWMLPVKKNFTYEWKSTSWKCWGTIIAPCSRPTIIIPALPWIRIATRPGLPTRARAATVLCRCWG